MKFGFALRTLFPFGVFSGDRSEGLDCFQLIFYLLSCCLFEHSTELRLGHGAAIFISFAEESAPGAEEGRVKDEYREGA